MDALYLKSKHEAGKPYEEYVRSGTPEQQANWGKIYDSAVLTAPQKTLLGSFVRKINVVGLSGIWCGDCAQQCPLIQRIAEGNPDKIIDLRWIDRDVHIDLQKTVAINGGNRVPVVFFCAEDYEQVSWYGDRTLNRYRAVAQPEPGAQLPPLPVAPVDADEMAATLQDWLNEFERVHLLLRLSGRLRKIHGDFENKVQGPKSRVED